MSAYKFLRCVGGTEIVLDPAKPTAINYIGHVWHDDDQAALLGMPCWNINDGMTYLWGYESRAAAVAALVEVM